MPGDWDTVPPPPADRDHVLNGAPDAWTDFGMIIYVVVLLVAVGVIAVSSIGKEQPRSRCASIGAFEFYVRGEAVCRKPDGSLWASPDHGASEDK